MASLKSGTTIGTYTAIHTNNISSYALTSVPSNVITTSGGQTIAGITYFSNGESLQVYGIRGRFTNEYIHLYNKVGIGNPSGWGQGEGNTPNQGLSTYGGIVVAYGNAATSQFQGHLRIDRNWGAGDYGAEQFTIRGTYPSITLRNTANNAKWLIHSPYSGALQFYYGGTVDDNNWGNKFEIPTDGNIWMSWANDYISNLLGAKQNASTAITTSNIGSQSVNYATSAGSATSASQVSGVAVSAAQAQALKNTLDSPTLPYKCDIYVEGEGDKFYPVHFMFGDQDIWRRIIIRRGYGEEAPWDPIGTGVHHGGLLLDWEGNFGGWGGAEYSDRLRVFNESYTNVCADMYLYTHAMGYVFMLRGGHALYHIFSDQPIRGYYQEGTPDIAYNSNTLFYDDNWSGNNTYDVYAPRPLGLSEVNSSRIDGLRTKKQSLFDNRYLRQGVDISGIGTISSTNFLASNAYYLNGTSYYLNSTNGGIYTNARFEAAGNLHIGGSSQFNGNVQWFSGTSAIGLENQTTFARFAFNKLTFWDWNNGYDVMTIDDGYVSSATSFRAPIFYDSNDTAFYVDPNSNSKLVNLGLGGATPDLRLSVSGDIHMDGYIYQGGTAGVVNSWGSRTLVSSGNYVSNARSFRFDNVGYGSTWALDINSSGNVIASVDMRAPIFYDSNDTSYYLDPNSTSRLYRVNSYYLSNPADVSDNHQYGMYFSSSLSTAYAIFREGGDWAWPYQDLRIAFHTGIKLGANAGYQGIRFYTDYDMVSQVMSVNNGSDPLGQGNVYVNNSLQADSSLRAPIFYDSNDTTYYLDPNSSGKSLNVAGNIDLIARSASWAEGIRVRVPSTSTWGGIRFTRDRGNDDGNWAIGYTGIDSSDDLTFWGNSGGTGAMRMRIDQGANLSVYGSVYSPIYYDINNTGYYGDFASTSVMNAIRLGTSTNNGTISGGGDWGIRFANDNGWIQFGPANNSWTHIYSNKNFYMNTHLWVSDGYKVTAWDYNNGGGALYATVFYDANDTGYYVDPNDISHLHISRTALRAHRSMSGYGVGNWVSDFSQTPISSMTFGQDKYDGGPSGTWWFQVNMRHNNGSNLWGTQLAYGWEDNANRILQRNVTGGNWSGWVEYLNSGNFTSWAQEKENQRLSTSSDVTHNSTTSPTFLVNSHSDNTKGYRIWNTSNSSVSAMFVNSSNQLVIAAGAVDQINLNKKVYVNGVALGVNVAPSATAGRIDASNDIVAYSSSDERLKYNIAPIENALDKVKSLTGVEFDWKPEYKHAHGYEGHDTGIIAQQVEAVMPSAVRTNDTGFLAVRYEKLIGLLIEGMKEQQAQIDELKAKLDGLTK